jgi:hypothetical protein
MQKDSPRGTVNQKRSEVTEREIERDRDREREIRSLFTAP